MFTNLVPCDPFLNLSSCPSKGLWTPLTSRISFSKNSKRVGAKCIFFTRQFLRNYSAKLKTRVISHYACDSTCMYLIPKRSALYLQLTQVWHKFPRPDSTPKYLQSFFMQSSTNSIWSTWGSKLTSFSIALRLYSIASSVLCTQVWL